MTTHLDPRPILSVARRLAFEAGVLIMNLRSRTLQEHRKADHSLVTNADHAADHLIRTGLRQAFPNHAILTEESGFDGDPNAEFIWLMDPLDGTRAYAKGMPGFCVMIGLLQNRQPLAGAVADPKGGFLYEAFRGEGAYLMVNGQRQGLRVSKRPCP